GGAMDFHLRRHEDHVRLVAGSALALALPALTIDHGDRFAGYIVTDSTAAAAAGVGDVHGIFSSCVPASGGATPARKPERISGWDALLVFLPEAVPARPEGFRRRIAEAGGQDIEMQVPASADHDHVRAIGDAAVCDGQKDLLACRLKLERDFSTRWPGKGQ